MKRVQWICGVLAASLVSISSFSQTYPSDFSQTLVMDGISSPTVMAFAPDGRIFVAQQNGNLRVIKDGALLPTSFVQLTVNSSGERGLIGIALDPDFSTNQFIYLYYTVPGTPAHNRVSRFTAVGDVALSGSELIILELDALSTATNHNGGALAFGPDGTLYIAVGDNANSANAQSLTTYHGKILRINKNGTAPSDNPFFAEANEKQKRVWAYGLRNPYTISFQPLTGKFFVNDVGQVTWEEINDATQGGLNFGWPTTEGNFNPVTYPNFTNPIYAYQHGSGDGVGCAITGGTFFNPSATNYPSTYYGKYFFLDYCNRWINCINPTELPPVRAPFATNTSGTPVVMDVGLDGNLYYLSRANGALYKIIYSSTSEPFITNHPKDLEITEGLEASFTVNTIGSTPFTYQWQKNDEDIEGATNVSFTIPNIEVGDEGQYRVIVSNVAGSTISNPATLSVISIVVGTEKPFNGNDLQIYPNPIEDGSLVIKFDSHSTGEGSIRIMNALSSNNVQLSVNLTVGENVIQLPTKNFNKGIHFVMIEAGNLKLAKKILVK